VAEPTLAERVVTKIEAAIEANPLAEEIALDGHSVSMGDALAKLNYWRRRVALEKGRVRRLTTIPLDRLRTQS
jgi:hypothetical protein